MPDTNVSTASEPAPAEQPHAEPPPEEPHGTTRWRRWTVRVMAIVLTLVLVTFVLPRLVTWAIARGDVAHRVTDVPPLDGDARRAAIVPGAGVLDDRPSTVLAQRIEAAVDLLERDRVDLILMSGDNSTEYYDEPTAMRKRAIELGAPPHQVAADYAGRSTWDTCVRAHDVFGIRSAVIVTNAFHVDRSVAICGAAGIDITGYSVSDASFGVRTRAEWRLREVGATGRALVDAWLLRPEPAVGGEPIDPYDACELQRSLAPSDAADEPPRERCD